MQGLKSVHHYRLLVLRLLVAAIAAVMISRLWQIQMVEGDRYLILSDQNRYRQVDVKAARGVIYDRNGEILARNRPSFTVAIVPADLPRDSEGEPDSDAEAAVLDRLLEMLHRPVGVATATSVIATPAPYPAQPAVDSDHADVPMASGSEIPDRQPYVMPREEIVEKIVNGRLGGAYRPIVIGRHLQQATAFLVAEDIVNLPGVQLQLDPIRDYPTGPITAHLIGYMGHLPQDQVDAYLAEGYGPDDQVGLTGLEYAYEDELRGTSGRQTIEVDVNGRKVRTVGDIEPSQPGLNLVLSVDMMLQRAATDALQEALSASKGFLTATQGAVIALDPRTGAVRALVSLPNHDNNLFAKGITNEAWKAITEDPDRPLFNRAIGGMYPPGSIYKIIVAAAGLQDGIITSQTKLGDGFDGVNDGIIWLANQYFPWDRSKDTPFYSWIHKYGYGHGLVSVRDALAVSDDIFFYQLGGGYRDFRGLGPDAIGYYSHQFGLGQLAAIELTGEARGLVPDPKWKRLNYAENWVTGDTYNLSIGQGFILATPLQMAAATAAVANRGFLYRPSFVDHITDDDGTVVSTFEPALLNEVDVDPAHLDTVREGMYGVTNWSHGTATVVRVPGVTVAGKTGTAEFFRDDDKDYHADRDEKGNLPTHAWFTSFAPYIDPEIVVTVFVANGGEGSSVAAPVANKVLNAYFSALAAEPAEGTSDAPQQ